MKTKITADSTCDLSAQLVEKYDIRIVPLQIVMAGKPYKDGLEITPKEIFQYVESGKGICQTTAVNVEEYAEVFRQELSRYDAVVHLNIGSGFSACYQNACIAAEEFQNVYVVDSKNLSTGMGHLVLDAALMAQSGAEPEKIKDAMDEAAGKLEASFVINSLKYLHKGGRCSAVAALGANLLQLKPCIEVIDGKMDVGKKYRGSFEKVIRQYVEDRLKDRTDIDDKRIFITSTCSDRQLLDTVKALVVGFVEFKEVIETFAGCTVSNHCGPDTLGILFYRK
ncbi:MAG: DegV family protein [Clostridiales bacterium]|jgi:DegV family protein with EDD domain|nr:DegV family protein [Clostridiales bacterium]